MIRLLSAILAIILIAGCSSGGDSFDPNYKAEVKLTPEEQAKAKANMANQSAPGTIDPKSGTTTPGAMSVPGKGK
jgi:hypothetical protein